jgi:Fimbrial assembly protein (PilN)
LDQIASTVARTENLWLTSMIRKGNNLSIEGSSASINAVANFITALKRSGYFQKVEIKESKQDDKNVAIQTFNFQLSAEISPPPPAAPAPRPQVKAVSAPATPAPAAAAPAKPPAAVPAKPAAAAPAKPAPASPTKPPAAAPKKPAPAPAAKPAAAPGTKKG